MFSNIFREIDENALEQALSAAVTCTILAGAGPQRSRVLTTLYKVISCGSTIKLHFFLASLLSFFLNISLFVNRTSVVPS